MTGVHCERSFEAAPSSFRTLIAVGRSYWSNQAASRRGVTDCTSSRGSNSLPVKPRSGYGDCTNRDMLQRAPDRATNDHTSRYGNARPTTGEAIVRHSARTVTQTSSAFAVTPVGR